MRLAAAFLAYGDAPSSHIQLQVVLQYVQTDPLALTAAAIEAAAIVVYLTAYDGWVGVVGAGHACTRPASSPVSCAYGWQSAPASPPTTRRTSSCTWCNTCCS